MVSSQAVLALTVCCAFTFGMIVVLLSSMRPHLAGHLHMTERRIGSLWAAMNFILVPLSLLAGMAVDVGDVRWVIVTGSVLISLALLLLRTGGGFRSGLVAFQLTAAGGACISTAAIVLMPLAFFGSGESSASLNLGNVFFSLGGLMAPALADVLLRGVGLRKSLLLLSLLALAPGALALFVARQDVPPPQDADLMAVVEKPILWLAAGVFFLYAPLEGCLHTWASTYLRNMGNDEREAQRLISGFWSSFLLGRLGMTYLLHSRWLPDHPERWLLCVLILFATVMIGNLVGTVHRKSAGTGLLLLGFFLGPIFPTLIGFLFRKFEHSHGTVFGILFAIGSAGSLVFAPLISSRINRGTAQSALRIPLFLGLLLLVLSLVFALYE